MCGIAGCVGHEHAVSFVADALQQMEERGYDSAGIAYLADIPKLEVVRAVADRSIGAIATLEPLIPVEAYKATTAIGHTRWATHGEVNVRNTHPQTNVDGTIAVVHNGVIENYRILREELKALGYEFASETDTEVVPHLLDHYLREGAEPEEAFDKTIKRLGGAFAILGYLGAEPDTIYAARVGSTPLHLGVRGDERFIASMKSPMVPYARYFSSLESGEMARLAPTEKYKTWHLNGQETTRAPKEHNGEIETAEIGAFEHWMLKEIYDGPQTVRDAILGRIGSDEGVVKLGGLEDPEIKERLKETERFVIVACGTSYHGALVGERLIEDIAGIPVETYLASDFKDRDFPITKNTAVIGISQSGETADTLGALHKAKEMGLLTLGVNNSPGSEMETITDAGVHCRAGKERSVASTKAFISQITVLAEIALSLADDQSPLRQALMEELPKIPEKMEQVIAQEPYIAAIAEKYAQSKSILYIGRGYEYISALEADLKLKEISYIPSQAYESGEMKHGPIALIEDGVPAFAIATDSPVYEKTLSNIAEIKAKKGKVIAIATEGNTAIKDLVDDVIYVPASLEQTQPLVNAVATQLFAYHVALKLGTNIDRPRNLAKSVTVE